MSLPLDLQLVILDIYLTKQRQLQHITYARMDYGVRAVCKAWDTHISLSASARTHLSVHSVSTAALVPFLPHLATLHWSFPAPCFLGAVLSGQTQLSSLTMLAINQTPTADSLDAVRQLTQLVGLNFVCHSDNTLPEGHLPLGLQLLPRLRSLRLEQLLQRVGLDAVPRIGLECLSTMQHLTSLALVCHDWRDVPASDNRAYTRPVLDVLSSTGTLSALRKLELGSWPCGNGPNFHRGWAQLAHQLPMLQHLTELDLTCIPARHRRHAVGGHFAALSSGLSRLARLRALNISGRPGDPYTRGDSEVVWQDAAQAAASDRLASAVGACTALTRLTMRALDVFLSARDCYGHMRGLTGLQDLHLDVVVGDCAAGGCAGGGAAAGNASGRAFAQLLPSLTQLSRLHVWQVPAASRQNAHLLCEAICAIPRLKTLNTACLLDEVAYTALAMRVRQHEVQLEQVEETDEQDEMRARLNALAGRELFVVPAWFTELMVDVHRPF